MKVDAVVYLVDVYDKERFFEFKVELDVFFFDEVLVNVSFLILGNKIDIFYVVLEDELRYYFGLINFIIGKGKVNLVDSNVRFMEVFMCSIVRKMGYGEGFKWVLQYIQLLQILGFVLFKRKQKKEKNVQLLILVEFVLDLFG